MSNFLPIPNLFSFVSLFHTFARFSKGFAWGIGNGMKRNGNFLFFSLNNKPRLTLFVSKPSMNYLIVNLAGVAFDFWISGFDSHDIILQIF